MQIRFLKQLLAVVLFLHLCAVNAAAEMATDEIDVYSGLAPVMTLSCTDLNFGVYQIARGDRGITGVTTATLSWTYDGFNDVWAANISFANAGQDMIALSDKPDYDAPSPAVCTVNGSRATSATVSVTSSPTGAFYFGGAASNPFAANLATPTTPTTTMRGVMTVPATVTLDATGAGSFVITGAVQIPNNLTANNYGSYKGQAVTMTVNDGL